MLVVFYAVFKAYVREVSLIDTNLSAMKTRLSDKFPYFCPNKNKKRDEIFSKITWCYVSFVFAFLGCVYA